MAETMFDELKRYVGFGPADEAALQDLYPAASPEFARVTDVFYRRIFEHEAARRSLEGGESKVGQLKVKLVQWMDELLRGPWDDGYFQRRCRIGRVHVRIALPQHYMFGAMDVVRTELVHIVEAHYATQSFERSTAIQAVGKILDLELAVMLHTYREDLLAQQATLFQEKLAAMGTLTAGLSHEIRNPLNAATLQLEVLERRLARLSSDLRPALLEPAKLVQEEIRRLDHLLEDFLQFARPKQFASHPVEVASLIPKVLDLLGEDAHRRGVEIRRRIETDAWIAGDEGRLRQVLMNLMLNALEAVDAGGWIQLSAGATSTEVILVVEDSGPGVPAEMRERIFEPFFTTKASGSGLGLPMVHAIVTRHGGRLSVETPSGGGARFVVHLPRADRPRSPG